MRRWIAALLACLFLWPATACHATLEVGIVRTPTPRPELALGRLAYVKDDDIWVQPLPDGSPRRLTTDGRSNMSPRWSPSGEWLSYWRMAREFWVMRADGTAARPVPAAGADSAPAWSPVEDRLAYIALQGHLMITDPAQEAQSFRASDAAGSLECVQRLAWSPDGQWVACEVAQWTRADDRGMGKPPARQVLRLLRADGGESHDLWTEARPLESALRLAGWSGDATRVLFWQGPASASIEADGLPLMSIPAAGGEPLRLAAAVLTHPGYVVPQPGSRQAALVAGSGREPWRERQLEAVSADGLDPHTLSAPGQAVAGAAWAPGSQRLAYVAMPARQSVAGEEEGLKALAERRIWVVNADGTGQRQLTADSAYRDECPLWSPDGEHILFARIRDWRVSLWLMQSDGRDLRVVAGDLLRAPVLFAQYGRVDWQAVFDWWTGLKQVPEHPERRPTAPGTPTKASLAPARQREPWPLPSPDGQPSPPIRRPGREQTAGEARLWRVVAAARCGQRPTKRAGLPRGRGERE